MEKRKQTRRAISMSGKLYEQLQRHCQANEQPVARFVERVVSDALKDAPQLRDPAIKTVPRSSTGPRVIDEDDGSPPPPQQVHF